MLRPRSVALGVGGQPEARKNDATATQATGPGALGQDLAARGGGRGVVFRTMAVQASTLSSHRPAL